MEQLIFWSRCRLQHQ